MTDEQRAPLSADALAAVMTGNMTPMSDEELSALRERWYDTVAAPWTYDEAANTVVSDDGTEVASQVLAPVEGRFIAACASDIPALLTEIERLRADRDHAREHANYLHALWDDVLLAWPTKPKGNASDGWVVGMPVEPAAEEVGE